MGNSVATSNLSKRSVLAVVIALTWACGPAPVSQPDGSMPSVDAGSPDAGLGDAGALDAGDVDAGTVDAGDVDAGAIDAGQLDAGALDAGTFDAGELDAGPLDAGPLDAGPLDAGPLDAGPLDAGAADAGALDAGTLDAGSTDGGAADAGLDAGVAPSAPTAVQATGGLRQVSVAWTGDGTETGFVVLKGPTAGSYPTTVTTCFLPGNGTPTCTGVWVDTGLGDGETWHYAVRAFNAAGSSAASSPDASALTLPAIPQGLAVMAGDSSATLTWTSTAQGTDSWDLLVSSDGVTFSPATPASSLTSPAIVTGLANGAPWSFALAARNSSGVSSRTAPVQVLLPPSAPTAPSASASSGSVMVTFSAPAGLVTGYQVYRGTSSAAEGATPIATAASCSGTPCSTTTTTFSDLTVSNGTTYFYVVRALNAGGLSFAASTEVSATPTSGSTIDPPTALTALGLDGKVALSWVAPASGTAPTSYKVFRSTVSGSSSPTQVGTSGTTAFTDLTASNGTTYFYRVTSSAAGGDSAFSNEASATPSRALCVSVDESGAAVSIAADVASATTDGSFVDLPVTRAFGVSTLLQRALSVAIDPADDELIVLSGGITVGTSTAASGAILTYPRTSNGSSAVPSRMIVGPATGLAPALTLPSGPLGSVGSLAFDPVHAELFVLDKGAANNTVTVYSRLATGNVSPMRTLTLPTATSRAIAIDTTTDQLVVLDAHAITWYPRSASGLASSSGQVTGIDATMVTGLNVNGLVSLTVDTRDSSPGASRVWVSDAGSSAGAKTFFLQFGPGLTSPAITLRAGGTTSTTAIYSVNAIAYVQDPGGAANDGLVFVSSNQNVGLGELGAKSCVSGTTTCPVANRVKTARLGTVSSNGVALAIDAAHAGDRLVAIDPGAQATGSQVVTFARTYASTTTPLSPLRTIDGPNSAFHAPRQSGLDSTHAWLWLSDNQLTGSTAAFATSLPGVSTGTSQRQVSVPGGGATGLVVDAADAELAVSAGSSVLSFDLASAAPDPLAAVAARTLTVMGTAGQLALDGNRNLYVPVTSGAVGSVQVYARNSLGAPTLLRTLTGPGNLLVQPVAVALDENASKLFVLDANGGSVTNWRLYRFSLSANGVASPEMTLTPDATSSSLALLPTGLTVSPGASVGATTVLVSFGAQTQAVVQVYCGSYDTAQGSICPSAVNGASTVVGVPLRRLLPDGAAATAVSVSFCQ